MSIDHRLHAIPLVSVEPAVTAEEAQCAASVKSTYPFVGAVLAIAALTGCTAPAAPAESPSATQSPSASAGPAGPTAAASVMIGGTTISALATDGTVIDSAPYLGDAETAMNLLNEAFQSLPVITDRATDSSCIADASIATWGDSFAMEYDKEFGPPWGTFDVISTGPSVGGVGVTTQTGFGVGGSLAELEASLPGAHTVLYDYSGVSQVHYEVGGGEWVEPDSPDAITVDYWGAAALAEGGTLTRLVAPVPYYDAC